MAKKLTRKQILKQDVVKSSLVKTWETIQKYPIHIAATTIALASLVLFAYAWFNYSNNKYNAVNEMFSKSFNDFTNINLSLNKNEDNEKKYNDLINNLNTIKRDYPNTLYAAEALYYLGNVQMKKGDYEKAIQSLNECINLTNDYVISGLALYSLAKSYASFNKYKEAIETIEKLEKMEFKPISKDYILFEKAEIYKKKGDISKSEE